MKKALNRELSYVSPTYHRFSSYRILYIDRREEYLGATVVWATGYGSKFLLTPFLLAKEVSYRYYYDIKVASWVLESKLLVLTDVSCPPKVSLISAKLPLMSPRSRP